MTLTGVTPKMLRDLREQMGESLTRFGLTLKHAIEPAADIGYSRQYISSLEHGRDVITPQIAYGFWHLATVLDDVPAAIGGSIRVTVLARPGQVHEDTFIPRTAKVKKCKRPGCPVIYLKTHPRQDYHDRECQKLHYKEKRKLGSYPQISR